MMATDCSMDMPCFHVHRIFLLSNKAVAATNSMNKHCGQNGYNHYLIYITALAKETGMIENRYHGKTGTFKH